MSSVVSINRFKQQSEKEVLDFIDTGKYMILRFDDEDETVNIMSSFEPGLQEATLIHMAYLFAISSLSMS
jgi:hypothetical protein